MNETELKIKVFPENILRKKARRIEKISQEHRDTLSKMARIMYDSSGIGLAAPQVGIDESLIVIDIGQGLYKFINPKIVKKQGSQSMEEGCLSVPGISIKVKRAKKVWVKAWDDSGQELNLEAEGLLACVFQHEIDHLNGKLILDYASFLEKIKIKKAIAELKKKLKDEKLPQSERKSNQLQL
jgi:peptide deformylase